MALPYYVQKMRVTNGKVTIILEGVEVRVIGVHGDNPISDHSYSRKIDKQLMPKGAVDGYMIGLRNKK